MSDAPEPQPELPPKEVSRIRHRDRKRETRMVVDNAGVRRVLAAVRRRRRPGPKDEQAQREPS
ncbi:MAG: hypothetical protein E6J45_10735 [Chloroflexi bacterium]|nr:MAG: hypothetical protein E6J45_10735 [Chloroflexota bacterium]